MPQPRISIHPVCLQGRHGIATALAASTADEAGDEHLRAGLGEREERWAEAGLHTRSEQRFHRVIERAFQIAEGDVRVHRQTFDLMEHRRVAGVGRIVAMDFAGNDNANRRLQLLHGANLHGRSVRAQQQSLAPRLRFLIGEKSVSCVSRAGWFGGKFSASKL